MKEINPIYNTQIDFLILVKLDAMFLILAEVWQQGES